MTTHEPGGRSIPSIDDRNDDRNDDTDQLTRVRGALQLQAVLPQMVGYHPDHSVVIVMTRTSAELGQGVTPSRVVMSCRVDLPPVEALPDLVQQLAPPLRRAVCDEPGTTTLLHVFAYDLPEDEEGEVDEGEVVALHLWMDQLAQGTGAQLYDVVLVRDGGRLVREVVARGEGVEGWPGWVRGLDPSTVPAAADLALSGAAALGSRAELGALVRRRDEDASRATGLALAVQSLEGPHPADPSTGLAPLLAWVLEGVEPLARERARIVRVLDDRWVRDALLACWIPGAFGLEELLTGPEWDSVREEVQPWPARHHDIGLDRLLILVGQVPRERTAALLTITALMAWSVGEGTIANEACDLALDADGDYVMAQLLGQALAQGMRPPRTRRRSGSSPGSCPDRRPAA